MLIEFFSWKHLKQGSREFHRKYVLVPADKAANNIVVVYRLHIINFLKQSRVNRYYETVYERSRKICFGL